MIFDISVAVLEEAVKIGRSLLTFNKKGKFTDFGLSASGVLAAGFAEKLIST